MSELPYKIINGNSLEVLDTFEENSIDAIITDPPYGLTSITKRFGKSNSAPCKDTRKNGPFVGVNKGFMGKEWDGSGIEYNVELWKKAERVLKPGGYLLAFGGSRTYHRIACAIEDAGFEIRDTIMWLYGSGFPKSMNIGLAVDKKNGVESKIVGTGRCGKNCLMGGLRNEESATSFEIKQAQNKWDGWGTALKPAFEPIIVARKSFKGSLIENIEKYGVGGINIDECRVAFEDTPNPATNPKYRKNAGYKTPERGQESKGAVSFTSSKNETNDLGRFPANVILTYDETDFDEVCGGMPDTSSSKNEFSNDRLKKWKENDGCERNLKGGTFISGFDDDGNACRYFYCAKATTKDRDNGLNALETKLFHRMRPDANPNKLTGLNKESRFAPVLRKNIHPTVKPVELMQYLVRLVTPKGGTILDIFNGSGSTGKAAMFENRERNANYKYIGIELDAEYCKISESRIDYALNKYQYDILDEIQENEKKGQLSLFDFVDD